MKIAQAFSDSITCVGRVGALAVALGVGAALVAMPPAYAEPSSGTTGGADAGPSNPGSSGGPPRAGKASRANSEVGGRRGGAHPVKDSAPAPRDSAVGIPAADPDDMPSAPNSDLQQSPSTPSAAASESAGGQP